MPRRPRVEYAGFHHIINRGVARGKIFLKEDDYEVFLEILEHTKKIYNFHVHSLCLMDNHYHLLIETKYENLSMLARQLNSKYAQYFNREYKRVGPLWQGRFKSWYVHSEKYLNALVRYVEQNPIKAGITQKIGEYRWSASTLLLEQKYSDLFEGSLLLEKEMFSLLDVALSKNDKEILEKLNQTIYKRVEDTIVQQKQISLDEYFSKIENLKMRNEKIILALNDGYKQSEIASYLNVTSSLVSYVAKHKKNRGQVTNVKF